MAATTNAQMRAGKVVLLAGNDSILVDILAIDSYIIRDLRDVGQGREGDNVALFVNDYTIYNYNTTRNQFNTGMAGPL